MEYEELLRRMCEAKGLRNPGIYSLILQYIALDTGKIITPTVISTNFKKTFGPDAGISHHTVAKYLNALVEDGLVLRVGRKYIRKEGCRPGILSANYYIRNPELFSYLASKSQEAFEKRSMRNNVDEYELALGRTIFANALWEVLTEDEKETLTAGRIDFFTNTKEEGERLSVLLDFIYERKGREHARIFIDAPLLHSLNGDQKLFTKYLKALKLRANDLDVAFIDPFNKAIFIENYTGAKILDLDLALDELRS